MGRSVSDQGADEQCCRSSLCARRSHGSDSRSISPPGRPIPSILLPGNQHHPEHRRRSSEAPGLSRASPPQNAVRRRPAGRLDRPEDATEGLALDANSGMEAPGHHQRRVCVLAPTAPTRGQARRQAPPIPLVLTQEPKPPRTRPSHGRRATAESRLSRRESPPARRAQTPAALDILPGPDDRIDRPPSARDHDSTSRIHFSSRPPR